MSIQTEIYFCFGCQLGQSIIHAAKFVGRKGLSAEFPDGAPQMPRWPTCPSAEAAAPFTEPHSRLHRGGLLAMPKPAVSADRHQKLCPDALAPVKRCPSAKAAMKSLRRGTRARPLRSTSIFAWGRAPSDCNAKHQQQQDFSALAQPWGLFDVTHTQWLMMAKQVWGDAVRIWSFKWKTLQGRRKCSNPERAYFTHAL